jgi:hypothetical protein
MEARIMADKEPAPIMTAQGIVDEITRILDIEGEAFGKSLPDRVRSLADDRGKCRANRYELIGSAMADKLVKA